MKRIACANENCGTFPMDDELHAKLQQTGETFHCPEGHPQHFGETTESKLREEVKRLRQKVEKLESHLNRRRERLHDAWDERQDERQRRKHVERLLLEHVNHIVEVGPGEYKWACPCGSRGQKAFESIEDAQDAYMDHHRRGCGLVNVSEVIEA